MGRRPLGLKERSLLARRARLARLLEDEGMKSPANPERFRSLGSAYCRVLEELRALRADL